MHFTYIISFISYNIPVKKILLATMEMRKPGLEEIK